MKLIPPSAIGTNSDAERDVFALLQEISFSGHDVALHSLNLGLHEYKRWGEADFVLVGRRGILLLEVKGGGVACRNGIWEFKNRFGEVSRKSESPATQAKSAFYALKDNYLEPAFGRDLAGIPMGWAVVFRGIDRIGGNSPLDLPEQPDAITAYRSDCAGPNKFRAFLDRAFEHWVSKLRDPRELSPSLASRITGTLRPSFERLPSLNSRLQGFRQELCQLTEEQYEKLDEIQENDRILMQGGAGTGKTFLAIACARYDAAVGREVLVVTRSEYLAAFLRSHPLPPGVTVATIDELGRLGAEHRVWDTLVIDEGQDLCQTETIDLLGSVLKGGLEKGRWRWFGDPNRQVSPSHPLDPDVLDYLASLGFRRRLKQNVRNAPRIVEAIAGFAGADLGAPRPLGSGGEVRFETVDDASRIPTTVASVLKRWTIGDGAAGRSEIVVLCPDDLQSTDLVRFLGASGLRAEVLTPASFSGATRDSILVAGTEDFKGLERPLVCIAGLPDRGEPAELRKYVYKGFSRANHTLTVVCPAEQATILSSLAVSGTQDGGNA